MNNFKDLTYDSPFQKASLIALHGLVGNPYDVSFFAAAFAQKLGPAKAPLIPGHRGSSLDLLNFNRKNIEILTQELIVKVEDSDSPAFVLSFSMGGLIVLNALDRLISTDNLGGVVFLAPALRFPPTAQKQLNLLKKIHFDHIIPWISRGGVGTYKNEIKERRVSARYFSTTALKEMMFLQDTALENLPLLKTIPSRMYYGSKDETVSAEIVTLFDSNDVKIIPHGLHHLGHDSLRDEIWEDMKEFFEISLGI